MATGVDLSRSQAAASDVIHEFSCSPCAKDGKNAEAEYYCVECKTYFCNKCVEFHNKFLSSHTLLDKTAIKSGRTRKQIPKASADSSLPVIVCEEHPGEEIKMFCGYHDVVCCTVCIAVDHRMCDGVEYIPNIAGGYVKVQERNKVKTSLEQVRQKLQLLISSRKKDIDLLNKEHDKCVQDIRDLKKCIVDRMEELERESIKQANSRYRLTEERLQSDIKSIDDMQTMTGVKLTNVKQSTDDNETELFIHVKQGQKQTSQSEVFLKVLENEESETIMYELNTEVKSVLRDTHSLVSLLDAKLNTHSVTPYTANLLGTYDVKVQSDKRDSDVYDCCILNNDDILITDYKNDKLKRLKASFSVTEWTDLPGKPYGVCKTGQYEGAVTLTRAEKVQFVSVGKTISWTRSFSVGTSCRGICYSQDKLYVCCAGDYREGPGQIKVYAMSGSSLHVFETDHSSEDLFGFPTHVSADLNGLQLYISDKEKGIVILDTISNRLARVSNANLNDVSGVTVDGRGSVFSCDFTMNTVVQTDRRGNVLRTLLSKRNSIRSPFSVTFVKNPNRLLISELSSNVIKVFKLT